MYRLNQNQDIIELLLKLNDDKQEYPVILFSTRRTTFLNMIRRYTRYVGALVMRTPVVQ